MTTAFPKDKEKVIERWVLDGLLRYEDKQKSHAWATTVGLQLPEVVQPKHGRDQKLLSEADVFNADGRFTDAGPAQSGMPEEGRRFRQGDPTAPVTSDPDGKGPSRRNRPGRWGNLGFGTDAAGDRLFKPGELAYEKLAAGARWLLGEKMREVFGSGATLASTSPAAFRRLMRDYVREWNTAQASALAIGKDAAPLSANERALLSDVLEKELQAGVIPPAEIEAIAVAMRRALSMQTDELVRLGMLSPAAHDLALFITANARRPRELARWLTRLGELTRQEADNRKNPTAGLFGETPPRSVEDLVRQVSQEQEDERAKETRAHPRHGGSLFHEAGLNSLGQPPRQPARSDAPSDGRGERDGAGGSAAGVAGGARPAAGVSAPPRAPAGTLPRHATTFEAARQAAEAFKGRPLVNRETGLQATVSRNALDKMLSAKAVGKSKTPALHALAVANLDWLFARATRGWSKPDDAGNTSIRAVHRFFAALPPEEGNVLVKLTVKELQPAHGNRLYSVEAVEINEKTPAAWWVDAAANADGVDPSSIRSAGVLHSLIQRADARNRPGVNEPAPVRRHDYHSEPSDAQKQAGNYKKEHVRWHGLDIALESQAGTLRRGVDARGRPWAVRLAHDYGYIKRTQGADGEHVDVFLGPHLTSDKVFIVNQRRTDGRGFDEHKVMLGFDSADAAEAGYRANYSPGWSHYEPPLVEMDVDEFKDWLRHGDTAAPARPLYRGKPVRLSTGETLRIQETPESRLAAARARVARLEALRKCVGA